MTLIEAVLFISVALGLIVGGIVFYQQASLSSRVAAQMRVISAVAEDTRTLMRAYDHNTDPTALGGQMVQDFDDVLIAAGAVPDSAIGPSQDIAMSGTQTWSTRVRTEWGTGLGLSVGLQGFSEILIMFVLSAIPVEACTRLSVTDAQGAGAGTRLILFISHVDEDGTGGGTWLVPSQGALSPANAAARCRAADGNGNGLVTLQIAARGFG